MKNRLDLLLLDTFKERNKIFFYINPKYFHNLSQNIKSTNPKFYYLQENFKISMEEIHQKATTLQNLMFPETQVQSKATCASDDNFFTPDDN